MFSWFCMFLSTLLFFIVLFGLMLGFVNTLTYLYITFSISLRNVIAWLIKIFKLKEEEETEIRRMQKYINEFNTVSVSNWNNKFVNFLKYRILLIWTYYAILLEFMFESTVNTLTTNRFIECSHTCIYFRGARKNQKEELCKSCSLLWSDVIVTWISPPKLGVVTQ